MTANSTVIRYVVTDSDYQDGWTSFLIQEHTRFNRNERRREKRAERKLRDRTTLPQPGSTQDRH
jgi:hypothetical protein